MTTRTTTLNSTGDTTRNSTNAGHNTDIAFRRHISTCSIPSPNRNNSDHTATKNHSGGDDPGDDDHGDGSGQGDENLGGPDDNPPDEDGPDDPSDDPILTTPMMMYNTI
jgi:hypothetical protein